MSQPAFEIDKLVKAFAGTVVLHGIDLRLEPGEILGYIGPNGAGKTTTVRVLLGLITDYRGEVRVVGHDPGDQPVEVRRRVGYVPETPVLFDALTVGEYLMLVGQLHDLDDETIRARGTGLLRALELHDRLGSRVGSLSKGMRQKLLVAAAVIHRPRLLLLDEPLSGLDATTSIVIKEFLRGFADEGGAVLYCSHVMDVVERVCDRIVILHEGRILAQGSFDELAAGGDTTLERLFVRMTRTTDDPSARARRLLAALAVGDEDAETGADPTDDHGR